MNVANESSPAPSLRRLPFLVRLAPQFVNRLAAALPTPPHMSAGTDGLLFGRIESEFAVVQGFRWFLPPLDRDEKANARPARQESFETVLVQSKRDPELAGFSLLGWFCVRTRSGLQAEDVAFHQRNFQKTSDIALILKSEPDSELSFEIYCRCLDGTISDDGHRWGTVQIAQDSEVITPVEVMMEAKTREDVPMRAYRSGEGVPENEPVPGWKDALTSKTKRAIEILKTVSSEGTDESEITTRDSEEFDRDEVEILKSPDHALRFGTHGGAAPAPARIPQEYLGSREPGDERKGEVRSFDSEEPRLVLSQKESSPFASLGKTAALPAEEPRIVTGTNTGYTPDVPVSSPPATPSAKAWVNPLATPSTVVSPAHSAKLSYRTTRKMPWMAMGAVFAVAAGGTFGLIYLRSAHARGTLPGFLQSVWPSPGLNLRLSSNGDRVQLSWNQNSPAVLNADEAVLDINDGRDHRQIRLGAGELANGSVLYLPNSDDIIFQLNVHKANGQNVSESLRVLGTAKPTVFDASQPANEPADTPNVRSASAAARGPEKQTQLEAAKNTGALPQPIPIKPQHEQSRSGDLRAANRVASGGSIDGAGATQSAASLSPVSAPGGATAAPPNGASSAANSPELNAGLTNKVAENVPPPVATPPRQTADSPAPTVPATSAAQSSAPEIPNPLQSGQSVPAPSGVTNSNAGQTPAPVQVQPAQTSSPGATPLVTYRPPRPLKQVLPKLSGLPPVLGDSPGEVRVLVKVDEFGHVVDARLIEGNKKVSSTLKYASMTAAKQWVFEPASLRGKSIASEHTILFEFRH